MSKFHVNWISDKASKYGTHQMLLQPLESHTVERDVTAKPVWCVWLPAAALPTYIQFLEQAKAASKKFVVEADVLDIKSAAVFTQKDGSTTQDLVIKFSGVVSKSVEADASVTW
jgi:hypothetical protein